MWRFLGAHVIDSSAYNIQETRQGSDWHNLNLRKGTKIEL